MKPKSLPLLLAFATSAILGANAFAAVDPLPSWNNPPKRAIIGFVTLVTKEGSSHFVPVPERIAVFDNDGTLWAEQPIYVQFAFAIDRVKALAPLHPEWHTSEPFASILRGDSEGFLASGDLGVMEVISTAHAGMTTEQFSKVVNDWITTARHPTTGRLYTEMVYQPMLELLAYLRANGFKTYIVSSDAIEFMRPWVERVYGIPPEQVVGSSGKLQFEFRGGEPVLLKLPAVDLIDNKEGKPIGIQTHIGRRPIFAFGNSDADRQMLEWTAARPGMHFVGLLHHDDPIREWAYDRRSRIGKLDRVMDEAIGMGWIMVSMKNDWKTIFPNQR